MITYMYPWVLSWGFALIGVYIIFRLVIASRVRYVIPTTSFFLQYLDRCHIVISDWQKYVRYALRCGAIAALLIALARPREPDPQSLVRIEGRDIVLTLDVSGSMQLFDDLSDTRSRWQVAQDEARRFIARRPHDPIGLVYFGAFALSRCPITLDKPLLDTIVRDTKLGDIDPHGTMLSQAIALSVQRLRHATSQNRIIILLTDGSPSEQDIPVDKAVSLAQKAGIRVYTIGVGAENGGFFVDPLAGVQQVRDTMNHHLLRYIAEQTGGQHFHAHNPQEVRMVYDAIDALEASEHDAPQYTHYYEYFMPFLWCAYICILLELLVTTYIWIVL